MDTTVKFAAVFLTGALCGLAAGLLLAPTTGKQARKKLNKKSRKLARKMAGYIGMEDKMYPGTVKRKDGRTQVEVQ